MKRVFSILGLAAALGLFTSQHVQAQTNKNGGGKNSANVPEASVEKDAPKGNNAQVSTKVPEMSPLNPTHRVSQIVPRDRAELLRMIDARSQKSKPAPQTAAPRVMPGTMAAPAIQLESHQNDK